MQYDLEELSATVFWPDKELVQSFDNFKDCREMVNINKPPKSEFTQFKMH
jgi:hypothetical protein